jgi:hypothetical protein
MSGDDISAGRLLDEALRFVGNAVVDVVPPDAQRHLLNAQREVLLAVAAIIDHNRDRGGGRDSQRRGGRPSRVELD